MPLGLITVTNIGGKEIPLPVILEHCINFIEHIRYKADYSPNHCNINNEVKDIEPQGLSSFHD
jgi:hypothetical protein